jgi:hypothetical protein
MHVTLFACIFCTFHYFVRSSSRNRHPAQATWRLSAGNVNGERYRAEILTPFLNELHDDELIYGYFQQDGATAHTTGATINFLSNFYADRLISRNTLNN